MREHSEHPELTGRQVGDKYETSVKSCGQSTERASHAARNTSPETNSKSSGPSMHPFKRSKNPSQVNLFGEKQARSLRITKDTEYPTGQPRVVVVVVVAVVASSQTHLMLSGWPP